MKSHQPRKFYTLLLALLTGAVTLLLVESAFSQTTSEDQSPPKTGEQSARPEASPDGKSNPFDVSREGSMTLDQMRVIINRLDENAQELRPGTFRLVVADFEVMVITAEPVNRMRVMVRIRSAENLTQAELLRISQANLDSALDARYAIGQGVLWSAYIHPISSLHPMQFIEAIGSTVNLAANYGTSYSSGQLVFGGGDSGAILGRKLIDKLIKKGQPI
ncbi:MAG: hypothetical protein AAGE61_21430 [Pseudomonadota bacterium]